MLVTGLFYREKLRQKFSFFTHVQQEAVSLSKQHQSSFHFYKIVKQQQQLPREVCKEVFDFFLMFWIKNLKQILKQVQSVSRTYIS